MLCTCSTGNRSITGSTSTACTACTAGITGISLQWSGFKIFIACIYCFIDFDWDNCFMPIEYSSNFRHRAVRQVLERLELDEETRPYTVIRETAEQLGIAAETLRKRVKRSEEAGDKPDRLSAQAEIRQLKRENLELRRILAMLRGTLAYFAVELQKAEMRK